MTENFQCTLKHAKAQRRWLYVCGVMPWNWFNHDIWTAWALWDRAVKHGKFLP